MKSLKIIDCTFRDGGYYNAWNFSKELIDAYLTTMSSSAIDYVEIGFRAISNKGFKGACAFSSDDFIRGLDAPKDLKIGVMINAADLVNYAEGVVPAIHKMFVEAKKSPVTLVRIAAHIGEVAAAAEATRELKKMGYVVGLNLMQVTESSEEDLSKAIKLVSSAKPDVLYFADSLGSMNMQDTQRMVQLFQKDWKGHIGIHAHDNMNNALSNTLHAIEYGVTWVDSTVYGMGRGAGNTKTEYLVLELQNPRLNISPLLGLVEKYFKPMQQQYGWGANLYYYLAGKYGIHPTYIQQMLSDSRYDKADILSVIEHLKNEGGRTFNLELMEQGKNFYVGSEKGTWNPEKELNGRTILILGSGPSVAEHKEAIENLVRRNSLYVMSLNAQSVIDPKLVNLRVACHPVRLLADCDDYVKFPQPLATPASSLPDSVRSALGSTTLLDYGLNIKKDMFEFNETGCTIPKLLGIAYALSIISSGKASKVLLAGFDGYSADDPRTAEMDYVFECYRKTKGALSLQAITPTRYKIEKNSVYAI